MAISKKRAKSAFVCAAMPKAKVAVPKAPVDDGLPLYEKKARAQYNTLVVEIADASRDEVRAGSPLVMMRRSRLRATRSTLAAA